MVAWRESWDLSSIPDRLLMSEYARRNALKRRSYSGGVYWREHNPAVPQCRCRACMRSRRSKGAKV